MARNKSKGPKQHAFRDKLLLNQWLVSLFGIDSLAENKLAGERVRPFHVLADPIKNTQLEGLGPDNLHRFYYAIVNSNKILNGTRFLNKEQILFYEENIVRHTQAINKKRTRPIVWKYYQWLTLLFVEIYLDRFFGNKEGLLSELNAFVERFNKHWNDYADVSPYSEDDLNKLCLQNATGSGKTLIMHINLLQYQHYAKQHGKDRELPRTILLTPNERLSEQHIAEFHESSISADRYSQTKDYYLPNHVDVLEITKLADKEGPNTFATRSLGDQNLLLVDEGHRGMSGKDEGVWVTHRSDLCAKGFTFEYSATFEQAVQASGNVAFENYAKSIIFDYSYRWFYEDGFGKDYQILNMPKTFAQVQHAYLTACLLKFYQQLRIFEENSKNFELFNLEKPLWVFVGSTVSKAKEGTNDEKIVVTDVAQIICFISEFLSNSTVSQKNITSLLTNGGREMGLLD